MESLIANPVTLLTLLAVKHLLADFVFQPPYMWMNKGTYGHPGLLHSGLHALITAVILIPFTHVGVILVLAAFEFVVHYHMDWFKMWHNARKGYKPDQHEWFWIWLGIDQFVHTMTYIIIFGVVYYGTIN